MTDPEMRTFVAALFADPDAAETVEEAPEPLDPAKGNVVPREGETPITTRTPAQDFVTELFERGQDL